MFCTSVNRPVYLASCPEWGEWNFRIGPSTRSRRSRTWNPFVDRLRLRWSGKCPCFANEGSTGWETWTLRSELAMPFGLGQKMAYTTPYVESRRHQRVVHCKGHRYHRPHRYLCHQLKVFTSNARLNLIIWPVNYSLSACQTFSLQRTLHFASVLKFNFC